MNEFEPKSHLNPFFSAYWGELYEVKDRQLTPSRNLPNRFVEAAALEGLKAALVTAGIKEPSNLGFHPEVYNSGTVILYDVERVDDLVDQPLPKSRLIAPKPDEILEAVERPAIEMIDLKIPNAFCATAKLSTNYRGKTIYTRQVGLAIVLGEQHQKGLLTFDKEFLGVRLPKYVWPIVNDPGRVGLSTLRRHKRFGDNLATTERIRSIEYFPEGTEAYNELLAYHMGRSRLRRFLTPT